MTRKDVHADVNSRESKTIRNLKMQGLAYWLKSKDADSFCKPKGLATNGNPFCMLCVSPIHKALPHLQKKAAWGRTDAMRVMGGGVQLINHFHSHYQHDSVKALCLQDMMNTSKRISTGTQ